MPPSDLADDSWHWNFLHNRVMPRVYKDMGEDCRGIFDWLVENNPELCTRIVAANKEVDSLCHPEAEHESFKAACKTWYNLLMEAKQGFEAWKVKQRQDAESVGKQESLGLPR